MPLRPCISTTSSLRVGLIRALPATVSRPRFVNHSSDTQRARALATNAATTATGQSASSLPPARWLADLKQRVGKCILFGLSNHQVNEVGEIMAVVANHWKELIAGSEGFLTGEGRAGLESREVVWGEMDSMVGHPTELEEMRNSPPSLPLSDVYRLAPFQSLL